MYACVFSVPLIPARATRLGESDVVVVGYGDLFTDSKIRKALFEIDRVMPIYIYICALGWGIVFPCARGPKKGIYIYSRVMVGKIYIGRGALILAPVGRLSSFARRDGPWKGFRVSAVTDGDGEAEGWARGAAVEDGDLLGVAGVVDWRRTEMMM